jgi:hypothetical protein
MEIFIGISSHIQQHGLDLADTLVKSVEGALDWLENPLIFLQCHQSFLHQLAKCSFPLLVSFQLLIEHRVRVNERQDGIADLLIAAWEK